MVVRKEKKSRKYRGYRTHGWGTKGQHRDRGKEGGRAIGMHKEKWSWLVKYGEGWYGKHGFRNPTSKLVSSINLRMLQNLIDNGTLKMVSEGGKNIIDLEQYGYDKLLGGGTLSQPVIIKVKYATEKAMEKIKQLGGEIILTSKE
ncbi:uL15 family ribosomal protein [Stygiolobus caldivivus]|uniref:Large ribosomal subunit protein uL15 n=1 Tax=Stygiolobus caldivivus TaxID=2824673 RepID=A0A8D5U8F1_9CREN|nr:uL15 family ribosomal protein [Stygiolobus caldivivus]BCU70659.1 50S ribosomal protein L15 [Stygiolobus caldivivus]